ncbi:heparin lyase I family protein [Novosphingobium sp. BW1]|uniref:heparin lyase I family protein n=1 Tax=Novosphingobium sp. BW1 TaxID=2592621 RepID=UPI0013968C14|nr:heparin lyase I family protein [Novosphingobium sp. BW1]
MLRKVLSLASPAAVLLLAPQAHAQDSAATALEAGTTQTIAGWRARVQTAAQNPVVVSGPADDPQFRFSVQPGMRRKNDTKSERSELSFQHEVPFGSDIHQSFSVMIEDLPKSSPRTIVGQWHAEVSNGGGPWLALVVTNKQRLELELNIADDQIERRRKSRQLVLHSEKLEPGRWYEVRLHMIPGDREQGYLSAWLNGRQVASYEGELGYTAQDLAGYFKFGGYRSVPSDETTNVFYRDVMLDIAPPAS